MVHIKYKLGFQNIFVVDYEGRSGGFTLLWGVDKDVEIQNYSK
jgi:hypothetical protein